MRTTARFGATALAGALLLASAPAFAREGVVAAAEAYVAKATRPSAEWQGPQSAPPPASGKKIVIVSCAQASNCSVDSAGALEGAKAIGWEASVIDGKGDPAVYNAAIRSAVNGGADGVITIAIAPSLVQDGLRFAKQHAVPVINAAEIPSKDALIAGNVDREFAEQGRQLAAYMIADSDAKAKVVLLRADEFESVVVRMQNVTAELGKCSDCAVLDSINITVAQGSNPAIMQQQVQSLIARFGDELKYIVTPYGTIDGLVVPALRARGRTDVKVVGFDGNKQQVQLCRQGSVGAVAVTMLTWTGWAAVDQMNRIFAGQEPVPQKVPAFLVVKDTCTGSGLAEEGYDYDFRAKFRELWGRS